MTVGEMAKALSLTPVTVEDETRTFSGVYIGDLLSWVMGRAKCDNIWITIMSNINIIAVATLVDVAVVILADGVALEESVRQTAEQKGVNIYTSEKTAYQLAAELAGLSK